MEVKVRFPASVDRTGAAVEVSCTLKMSHKPEGCFGSTFIYVTEALHFY